MKRKVVFICLCCSPFISALSATRLTIPPEGVAFGEIAAGEAASKSIELRNASTLPVAVSQVKGCCGADAALSAMRIEPAAVVTLSVSLHAPDDETRSALMPVNRRYNVASLLEACRIYFEKTGRRVSFEYTLISGKNDGKKEADALAAVLKKGMRAPCHVNLILLNAVAEIGLSAPDRRRAEEFRRQLETNGVNATIRRRLGSDIDASCGQLRLSKLEQEEEEKRRAQSASLS